MNVLVVDDRADNRLILEIKLKAAGFAVRSANNGAEALAALREQRADIVVTDLMMPRMDGFQLVRSLKLDPAWKTIPVLVYTATFTDPKDEALAYNLGADGFVRKPATDEEFFAALHRLLEAARRGELHIRTPRGEEIEYLRAYTDRLIAKLESKLDDLEVADRKLREANQQLEQRVRDATQDLRRAHEDMAAFAYSVSHDLRSPLRIIEEFVSTVRTNDPPLDAAERNRLLLRAETIAADTQVLIGELLDYAQLNSGTLALGLVDLASSVERAVAALEPALRATSDLEVLSLRGRVRAHAPTLMLVLQNLLSNALKFTPPGQRPHVTVSEERGDGIVRCLVRDRGIGVPPEAQQRIFQVFERLHPKADYPGTGVGLAIVQRAIEKMGGKVGLESTVGEGSTFWFELPAAE